MKKKKKTTHILKRRKGALEKIKELRSGWKVTEKTINWKELRDFGRKY